MSLVHGSCLCGGVTYEVPEEDIGEVTTCYCTLCRKNHGAERRLRARTISGRFRWVTGEHLLSRYPHGTRLEKHFCRICGTPLINRYMNDSSAFGLAIATLDEDPGKRATRHDHIASKPGWLAVEDGLPQFETVPDIVGRIVSIAPAFVFVEVSGGDVERLEVDPNQVAELYEGANVHFVLPYGKTSFEVRSVGD